MYVLQYQLWVFEMLTFIHDPIIPYNETGLVSMPAQDEAAAEHRSTDPDSAASSAEGAQALSQQLLLCVRRPCRCGALAHRVSGWPVPSISR